MNKRRYSNRRRKNILRVFILLMTIAVLSCLVWVGLWMMIVANDVIYQKIVTQVWVAMLILTFVYFIFCVQKSLLFDEKILEDYMYEIRI